MKNYIIYIAGKITGEDHKDCMIKFDRAENLLKQIHPSIQVVNPLKLGLPVDTPREQAMPFCLHALSKCHAIYLLSDWIYSEGAREEFKEANEKSKALFMEQHQDHYILSNMMNYRIDNDDSEMNDDHFKAVFKTISEYVFQEFKLRKSVGKSYILHLINSDHILVGTPGIIIDKILELKNQNKLEERHA